MVATLVLSSVNNGVTDVTTSLNADVPSAFRLRLGAPDAVGFATKKTEWDLSVICALCLLYL